MFDTQLMKLKRVLDSNHIDRSMYSLNGYADERVCLEKFGDGWDVYIGERGMKYDLRHYSSFGTACIRMIEELAESSDEERKTKYMSIFPVYQTATSGSFQQKEYKYNCPQVFPSLWVVFFCGDTPALHRFSALVHSKFIK